MTKGRSSELALMLSSEGNINRAADPKFAIGVAAVENGARIKAPANMVFGSRVAESGFDRVIDFARIAWIDKARWIARGKLNIAAAERLQVPISGGEFPAPELLEETDCGDVLVVSGGTIPAV